MCKRVCFKAAAVNIIVLICMIGIAQATPSSTFWTPMTPDIQPYGVLHIGVDNYFSKEKTGGPYFRQHLAALQFSIFPDTFFARCNGHLRPAKNNYINSKS